MTQISNMKVIGLLQSYQTLTFYNGFCGEWQLFATHHGTQYLSAKYRYSESRTKFVNIFRWGLDRGGGGVPRTLCACALCCNTAGPLFPMGLL